MRLHENAGEPGLFCVNVSAHQIMHALAGVRALLVLWQRWPLAEYSNGKGALCVCYNLLILYQTDVAEHVCEPQ